MLEQVVFMWCDSGMDNTMVHEHAHLLSVTSVQYIQGYRASKSVPSTYVAFDDSHIDLYERWFPGLRVRLHSLLKLRPLDRGGAVFLPVWYNSWVIRIDGPLALGAALEASRHLGAASMRCPMMDLKDFDSASCYDRVRDRVIPRNLKMLTNDGKHDRVR